MHIRRALRALVIVALLVAALFATLTPSAASATAGRVAPNRVVVEANVSYGRNPAQRADVALPTRAAANGAAVVLIHGGGWVGGDKADLVSQARRLANLGYVVASPNYRLAPRYRYPAAVEDVAAAVNWLAAPARAERYGIDQSRIGVVGYSAGGQLAAMLATTDPRVAAAVSFSGVYDFSTFGEAAGFLGCDASACPNRARAASPIDHVHEGAGPLLLISSADDPLVPAQQLTEMNAALADAQASHASIVVPGDGHATTLPPNAWVATTVFLAVSLEVPIPPL